MVADVIFERHSMSSAMSSFVDFLSETGQVGYTYLREQ